MELHITEILEISKRGRVKLFGNAWFAMKRNYKPTVAMIAGKRYRFKVDMELRVIHEVTDLAVTDKPNDDLISALYERVDGLKAIIKAQRELLVRDHGPDGYEDMIVESACYAGGDELESEINMIEHARMVESTKREVKRETWINYTGNPGMVTILWNRIRDGHTDRLKGGRDIRARIADFCESVPSGMLPDEIKDHVPGQYETGLNNY